jgi:hypothetical protein
MGKETLLAVGPGFPVLGSRIANTIAPIRQQPSRDESEDLARSAVQRIREG